MRPGAGQTSLARAPSALALTVTGNVRMADLTSTTYYEDRVAELNARLGELFQELVPRAGPVETDGGELRL